MAPSGSTDDRSAADPSRQLARRPHLLRIAVRLSFFAALLSWTSAVRAPFLSLERSDDAFFLEVAHLWTRGVLPYVGAFDIKPPGFFAILVAAEALLGPTLRAINAASIFADAVAATALYYIGRRMGSSALGLFAALLYPFLSETVTNNAAYAPLAAFTTLGFLAALSPLPIEKRSALAGLAIGAAFTIKQTAAFEGLALIVILMQAPEAAARRIGVGLAFVVAGAMPSLGFLIYFAAHGAAGAMIADVVGAAMLRPASAIERVSFVDGVMRTIVYLVRPIEPIFMLACLALMRRRAILAAAPDAALGAIGLWASATILSVWAQHALFRAYLAPMLAPSLPRPSCGASRPPSASRSSASSRSPPRCTAATSAPTRARRRRRSASRPRRSRRPIPAQTIACSSPAAACGST